MNDQSSGGINTQSNRIRDGMANVEEVHFKWTNLARVARVDGFDLCFGSHAVFGQFDFQQSAGQGGGINGCLNFFEHMANGAGMVFMTMSDNDASHLVAPGAQIGEIRDDVINAQHIIFREHQSGIHQ